MFSLLGEGERLCPEEPGLAGAKKGEVADSALSAGDNIGGGLLGPGAAFSARTHGPCDFCSETADRTGDDEAATGEKLSASCMPSA